MPLHQMLDVEMRTTIDLDEELLRTAKAIAAIRGETLSRVIGDLAWQRLHRQPEEQPTRNGFPLLPARPGAQLVTPEHVEELLAESDIGSESGR